jgi:acetyltransferase-like isoleucine patch superfamily enzyme
MKTHPTNKNGAALALAMITVIIVTLFILGIMHLGSVHGIQTARFTQSAQAFWIAEAGLNHTIDLLMTDPDLWDNVTEGSTATLDGDLFNGSSHIEFSGISQPDPDNDEIWQLTVYAAGSVQNQTRAIQTTITAGPGFDSAIWLVGDGETTLKAASVAIYGKIYIPFGSMDIANNAEVPDGIYTTDANQVDGNDKNYFVNEWDADDFILPPDFEDDVMPFYNDKFNDHFVTNTIPAGNIDLPSDGYTSQDGDLLLADNSQITGDGTLLVSGNLTIGDNVTIGDGVTIIANGGVIQTGKEFTLGENVTLYSGADLTIGKHPTTEYGSLFVAAGDVTMDSGNAATIFKGIIYAGGDVHIYGNFDVEGSIVSEGNIELEANVKINYDPSVFGQPLPEWLKFIQTRVLTQRTWEEIPSS